MPTRRLTRAAMIAPLIALVAMQLPAGVLAQTEDEWLDLVLENFQAEEQSAMTAFSNSGQTWAVSDPNSGEGVASGTLYTLRTDAGSDLEGAAWITETASYCQRILAAVELRDAAATERAYEQPTFAQIGGCMEAVTSEVDGKAILPMKLVTEPYVVDANLALSFIESAADTATEVSELRQQVKKLKRQLKKARGN